MTPGHVTVKANIDKRKAVDSSPHGVVAARNGEMYGVEAADAEPGEMGECVRCFILEASEQNCDVVENVWSHMKIFLVVSGG